MSRDRSATQRDLDDALAASFPANDPPAMTTSMTAGTPRDAREASGMHASTATCSAWYRAGIRKRHSAGAAIIRVAAGPAPACPRCMHPVTALQVPGVLCNEVNNLLLNPGRPDAGRIEIAGIDPFKLDPRMLVR